MKHILITCKISNKLIYVNINCIVYIYTHDTFCEILLINDKKLRVVETIEELLNQITIINKLHD
jgi:DNA-binding LytR/AlgR family response regulator